MSTVDLTAGVWRLCYEASLSAVSGASTNNVTWTLAQMTNSGGTLIGSSVRMVSGPKNTNNTSVGLQISVTASEIVTVATTTTYKFQAKKVDGNGTGSAAIYNSTTNGHSVFYAVRIA
jgi:hypothetical protein